MPSSSHPHHGLLPSAAANGPLVPAELLGVPAPREERRRRRRRWLLLLLLLFSAVPSVLTSYISVSMLADRSLAPNDAFAAVEVDVVADPPVLVIAGGMLPGDAVTGSLSIENRGTQPIRYSVTSASTHHGEAPLAEALVAEVRTEGTGCPGFDGTVLYRGALDTAVIGNPAHGADLGDRRLDAGSGEVLCVAITLPRPAGDRFQASSATTAFTVSAEEDR